MSNATTSDGTSNGMEQQQTSGGKSPRMPKKAFDLSWTSTRFGTIVNEMSSIRTFSRKPSMDTSTHSTTTNKGIVTKEKEYTCEDRLFHAVREAGRFAQGIDAVEVWMMEDIHLVQPKGGWYRNPAFEAADENALQRIENKERNDYVEPPQQLPGTGLAGSLWTFDHDGDLHNENHHNFGLFHWGHHHDDDNHDDHHDQQEDNNMSPLNGNRPLMRGKKPDLRKRKSLPSSFFQNPSGKDVLDRKSDPIMSMQEHAKIVAAADENEENIPSKNQNQAGKVDNHNNEQQFVSRTVMVDEEEGNMNNDKDVTVDQPPPSSVLEKWRATATNNTEANDSPVESGDIPSPPDLGTDPSKAANSWGPSFRGKFPEGFDIEQFGTKSCGTSFRSKRIRNSSSSSFRKRLSLLPTRRRSSGAASLHRNEQEGHRHHPAEACMVWRDIHSLTVDPDQPTFLRLKLLEEAGFGKATGVRFDFRGQKGIVLYLAKSSTSEEILNSPENCAYMRSAADLVGAAVSLSKMKKAVLAKKAAHENNNDVDEDGTNLMTNGGDDGTIVHAIKNYIGKLKGGDLQPPPAMSSGESSLTFFGAFSTLLVLAWISECIKSASNNQYLIVLGPFGALMTLQYGLTMAPASQPRNALFGQIIAVSIALVFTYIPESIMAVWVRVPLATASAIASMTRLGITHPPAGAAALIISSGGFDWLVLPLMLLGNVIALITSTLINNISDKRQYPTYFHLGISSFVLGIMGCFVNDDDCECMEDFTAKAEVDFTKRSGLSLPRLDMSEHDDCDDSAHSNTI